MSAAVLKEKKVAAKNGAASGQDLLSPLNLHWAGVGLLALVNVYLIAQMLLLWHGSSRYDADAISRQQTALNIARAEVQPLRGLDAKLAGATMAADRFYVQRLPVSDSEIVAEVGALTKRAGVRLAGAQYMPASVLAGSSGELTEVHIDARLSGDYRPLVLFLNSLERDRMFFVISGVTLTGQQTGTVNLRLRLTTYLRSAGIGAPAAGLPEIVPATVVTNRAGGSR